VSASPRLKILVVGVGGQGALTAARFLGDACLAAGVEVVVGQLHGMSQRGGSVECSVLVGPGKSTFIGAGEVDVLLGLEPLEALRALPRLSSRSRVVVNRGIIVPFNLAMQGNPYPPLSEILGHLRAVTPLVYEVDGPALVKQVGEGRTLNVVLLGALGALGVLPFGPAALWQAVARHSPPRFLEANRRTFALGMEAIQGQL
jgi:indolepyruvate ferredoxin oxidoreductase beta subunit